MRLEKPVIKKSKSSNQCVHTQSLNGLKKLGLLVVSRVAKVDIVFRVKTKVI